MRKSYRLEGLCSLLGKRGFVTLFVYVTASVLFVTLNGKITSPTYAPYVGLIERILIDHIRDSNNKSRVKIQSFASTLNSNGGTSSRDPHHGKADSFFASENINKTASFNLVSTAFSVLF